MDAYEVVKDRYQQGLVVERSVLREFVNSLEVPSLSDPEARAQFAQSQLLRLGVPLPDLRPAWERLCAVFMRRAESPFAYGSFPSSTGSVINPNHSFGAATAASSVTVQSPREVEEAPAMPMSSV
uniref:EH domain-containing protein n=1 Tax=Steinernema glaseri TaxID=37863 RepID=A0A1I7YDJ8_9BILA